MEEILTQEELNKKLINNGEQRIADYKVLLEQIGRNRDVWDPQNEFTQWFRATVREMKNLEDKDLDKFREEQRWTRQGLNPPHIYPEILRKLESK